jgi:GH15 family glucan-1,4-alpha-glucosidase
VRQIEKQLMHKGLVRRYKTRTGVDGLPPGEGAFLACSFWLVDNYTMMGRRKDALRLFHRLRRLANDVGLYAEEYDPVAKRMLGNFPQAFSHVALINSALDLMEDARQQAEKEKRKKKPARSRKAVGKANSGTGKAVPKKTSIKRTRKVKRGNR